MKTNYFQMVMSNSRGMVALLLGLMLIGCGVAPKPMGPQVLEEKEPVSQYIIGPGDVLNMFVWRNPDVTITVPVRPDGKISTPLVEDMVAIGKTPFQLARDIEGVLSTYIKAPVVTVIVTEFGGPYSQQVRVLGEATDSQALPYRENMTLLDVMISVGGLTEFAAGNRARIVRGTGAQQREFRVYIEDLMKDGDIGANVRMRPGDILIIPSSWF